MEDQVVLADHRTDADLLDERDLEEILNLHKAKPEVCGSGRFRAPTWRDSMRGSTHSTA